MAFKKFNPSSDKSNIKTYNSPEEIVNYFKESQNNKEKSKIKPHITTPKKSNQNCKTKQSINTTQSGFKIGDSVKHPKFGQGKILKITNSSIGRKLMIYFDESGVKTLVENIAKLDKL